MDSAAKINALEEAKSLFQKGNHLRDTAVVRGNIARIMFDIDHFKLVNDTYGHPAGDDVLIRVSRAVYETIRKGDYLARYGGEEFVVVLPETKLIRAMELAERLRQVVADLEIRTPDGRPIKVTSSFGVAALKPDSDAEKLMKETDDYLYKAKRQGRNQVMPGLKMRPEGLRQLA